MRRLIQRLRKKHPKTRQRVAVGTSAVITAVIFAGWVTVVSQGVIFSDPEPEATQTASPLSAFGDNASAIYSEFSESFPGYWNGTSTQKASTTSTTSTESFESNSTQRVDDTPYWEANNRSNQPQQRPSATQEGEFWSE